MRALPCLFSSPLHPFANQNSSLVLVPFVRGEHRAVAPVEQPHLMRQYRDHTLIVAMPLYPPFLRHPPWITRAPVLVRLIRMETGDRLPVAMRTPCVGEA